ATRSSPARTWPTGQAPSRTRSSRISTPACPGSTCRAVGAGRADERVEMFIAAGMAPGTRENGRRQPAAPLDVRRAWRNAAWWHVIGVTEQFDPTLGGGTTMKYTVLIYESEADFNARTDEVRKGAYWGAYRAYTEALRNAGIMVGGAALQPPNLATAVR